MDLRILDLVTTKYLTKKVMVEIELEKLINNPPLEMSAEELSDKIMEKVSMIRNIGSDIQTWENIVAQVTKKPEEGNNN